MIFVIFRKKRFINKSKDVLFLALVFVFLCFFLDFCCTFIAVFLAFSGVKC